MSSSLPCPVHHNLLAELGLALEAKGDEKAATIDDIVELLKSAAKEIAIDGPDPLPAP
jgi:hypothetical protein